MILVIGVGTAMLIGTAISAVSAWYTNKQNRKDASNAVQRRADDLRSAGFNPVLAATQGAQIGKKISPGADAPEGARAFSALSLQKGLIKAQTAKLGAETLETNARTQVLKEQAPLRAAELNKAELMSDIAGHLKGIGETIENAIKKGAWAQIFVDLLRGGDDASDELRKRIEAQKKKDKLRNDVIDAQGKIRRPGAIKEMPDKRLREKIRR